jgi:hypothetical protein
VTRSRHSRAAASGRGCVETLNLARQTTNLLCSNFSASRKASVEAATPSSWRWKNQALPFPHSLGRKPTLPGPPSAVQLTSIGVQP